MAIATSLDITLWDIKNKNVKIGQIIKESPNPYSYIKFFTFDENNLFIIDM